MSPSTAKLAAQLKEVDAARRCQAAESLCRMGVEAQDAAVALVGAMGDSDEETRQWASAALEELGPPDVSAAPTLAALLQAENIEADVAYWAATLLGRLEAEGASAVPQLTKAAQEHFSMAVRERAVWAIGKIGPSAASAKGVLEQLAGGDQPRLARLAKTALEQLGG